MKEKAEVINIKPPRKVKSTSRIVKSLGPVSNLEEHIQSDWWRCIFNSMYLKTDGDVVDDPLITAKEVDAFSEIAHLSPDDRILDLCCGQGRISLELARRGFGYVDGLDRSRYLILRCLKRSSMLQKSVWVSDRRGK